MSVEKSAEKSKTKTPRGLWWVLGGFAALFVVLALSMFGFYELQLPSALQSRLAVTSNRLHGGHFAGVFGMGVLSALIVGYLIQVAGWRVAFVAAGGIGALQQAARQPDLDAREGDIADQLHQVGNASGMRGDR